MRTFKIAVLIFLLAIGIIITVQNTDVVTLRLFVWEFRASQMIVLPLVFLSGMVVGWLWTRMADFQRSRRAAVKATPADVSSPKNSV